MTLKTVVELSDSRLLQMMKSTLFIAEFPILKSAYDEAQKKNDVAIPPGCSPCKRKRLLQQGRAGSRIDFAGVRQSLASLPNDRKLRLKTLLQAKTVRIPNITKNGRKTTLQF